MGTLQRAMHSWHASEHIGSLGIGTSGGARSGSTSSGSGLAYGGSGNGAEGLGNGLLDGLHGLWDSFRENIFPTEFRKATRRRHTAFPAYNADQFIALTRFRQQHRRTRDGRLCAAAFIQDQQPFTNCTDIDSPTPAPNNVASREWCYVEPQLLNQPVDGKTLPNWDFCSAVPDYDELRQTLDLDGLEGLPEGAEKEDAGMDGAAEKASEAALVAE